MLKIAMIGIMAAFLAMPLKKDKAEFSMLIILGACVIILSFSLGKIGDILDIIHRLESYLGKGSLYVGILLKMVGITYVAEFAASICNDAGYQAVGHQIEFYGKLMILAVSVPILMTLVETIMAI